MTDLKCPTDLPNCYWKCWFHSLHIFFPTRPNLLKSFFVFFYVQQPILCWFCDHSRWKYDDADSFLFHLFLFGIEHKKLQFCLFPKWWLNVVEFYDENTSICQKCFSSKVHYLTSSFIMRLHLFPHAWKELERLIMFTFHSLSQNKFTSLSSFIVVLILKSS